MELKVVIEKKGPLFEGRTEDLISASLDAAMHEALRLMEDKVREKTPEGVFGEAGGGLRGSIFSEAQKGGKPIVKGIIATQSKYGMVIEKGRRPGQKMPPQGMLFRWMMLKLGMDSKTAKSKEFIIRRKIGQKGFPGAQMFEKAFDENLGQIRKIFEAAGYKIARALNGE